MVLCIIGIVVFGILGIFSAKYRGYFKESLKCFSRMATLRPCDTDFDNKMKSKIAGKLMSTNEKLASFIFNHFRLLSWIFMILFIVSIALIVNGLYNAWVYGNCNGPESGAFCIFNIQDGQKLSNPGYNERNPFVGNENASIEIIEFGCFTCPYTARAESTRKELVQLYGDRIKLVFRAAPITNHRNSREAAEAAQCSLDQGLDSYWKYHEKLFQNQNNLSKSRLAGIAAETGINTTRFIECIESRKYAEFVESERQAGLDAGVTATPTWFIGDKSIVGYAETAKFKSFIE